MQILHRFSKFKFLAKLINFVFWPLAKIFPPRKPRVRAVIISADKKVLLFKHYFGPEVWLLPGGGVHRGESNRSAIQREIQEELSFKNRPKLDFKQLNDQPQLLEIEGFKMSVIIYRAILAKSSQQIDFGLPSAEVQEAKWFDLSSPEVRRALPPGINLKNMLE